MLTAGTVLVAEASHLAAGLALLVLGAVVVGWQIGSGQDWE